MSDITRRVLTEYAYTYEEKNHVREGHLAECLDLIMHRQAASVKWLLLVERIRMLFCLLATAAIGYLIGSKSSPPYFAIIVFPILLAPRFSQLAFILRHQARVTAISDLWRMKSDASSIPSKELVR